VQTAKKQSEKKESVFKFEVGSMYENMKGAYEVVSIENESMTIRWENGNEVVTTVDLQKRIMERMVFEEKLQQQEGIKKEKKPSKKSKKK
jgi:hypothetical protein